MNKSGTTSIQAALSAARPDLLREGVLYPLTGRLPDGRLNHRQLLAEHADAPPQPGTLEHTLPGEWARMLQAEVALHDVRTVILSNEALWPSAGYDTAALQRVRDALDFATVEVLITLREPSSWLPSTYAQSIAGPRATRLSFAERVQEVDLDYRRRLDQFTAVFDQVHVHWFEDAVRDSSLLTPLLHLLEVPEGCLPPLARHNSRMSWPLLRLLRRVNAVAGPSSRLRTAALFLCNQVHLRTQGRPLTKRLDRALRPDRALDGRAAELARVRAAVDAAYDVDWWRD